MRHGGKNQFKCFLKQEFPVQSMQKRQSAHPKTLPYTVHRFLRSSTQNPDDIMPVFKLFMLRKNSINN